MLYVSLITAQLDPTNVDNVVFSLSFSSARLPLWHMDYLEGYCFISRCLEISCHLTCIDFQFGSIVVKNTFCISVLVNLWSIFYGPRYGLCWYVFHELLEESVLRRCWAECSVNSSYSLLLVLLSSSVSVMTVCLAALSLVGRGVLKSPAIIVDLSSIPLHSIGFCFTYFAALLFGA